MKIIASAAVALLVFATLASTADATFWSGNGKGSPKNPRVIFTDKNLP